MSLAELLPAAVGIAMNPPAVLAVILMLSSPNSRSRAYAFLGGWSTGLFVVGAAVLIAGDAVALTGDLGAVAYFARILLGVGLLLLAYGQWRKGRSAAEDAEMPAWMSSLTGLSASRAFLTALLFAGLNPKTLALNVAGVLIILDAELAVQAQLLALAVFVAVASVTVAAPVAYYVVSPDRAANALARSQRWLVANSAAVAAVVLLILGVMVLATGVQGVLAL